MDLVFNNTTAVTQISYRRRWILQKTDLFHVLNLQCALCSVPCAGYSGEVCENDRNGCTQDVGCFNGVQCTDNPAPLAGATCGPCPAGFSGDGRTCTGIYAVKSDFSVPYMQRILCVAWASHTHARTHAHTYSHKVRLRFSQFPLAHACRTGLGCKCSDIGKQQNWSARLRKMAGSV